VINLGDPFIRTVPGVGSHRQPMQLIAGQITRAININPSGRIDLWGVRFQPWSAAAFLGASAVELRDQLFSLDEVARSLEEPLSWLGNLPDPEGQARLVHALEAQLAKARSLDAVVAGLVRLVATAPSDSSVRELADHAGLTVRRVEMLFREEVGLTPKQLLRITRFQRALGIARMEPTLSWSAVAVRAGYFDQAHLIHESHDIAACTPATLLGREAELTLTEHFLTR
jgi:AraC-like DNA-binding protein